MNQNLKQWGIILLTLATAGIHVSLLFPDPLFILNGAGFLVLLAAYILPINYFRQKRSLIRVVFMAFTAVTILAWVAIGDKSWPAGMLGFITKAIELALLGFLWSDRRSSGGH
jgi:hypothetical protein